METIQKNQNRFSFQVGSAPDSRDPKFVLTAAGKLDRSSPVPLYHQLYTILLLKIESGEWKSGELIPTEKALSEQYGLSRITVRQSIQILVADGMLSRQQGRGTFVTKLKLRHGPQRAFGLTGYLRAHGLKPGWRRLQVAKVKASRKVATFLGLSENQLVMEIRRLRLADDEVIGLHMAYLPYPLAESVKEEYLTQGDSSLYYLEVLMGIPLSESNRIIEAVPASESEAKLLKVRPGAPLLQIQRITNGADGHPLEFLRAVYRGDRFEYYVHLKH